MVDYKSLKLWSPLKTECGNLFFPQELNSKSISAREHGNISRGTTQTYLDTEYHMSALYYCQWSGIKKCFIWVKPWLIVYGFCDSSTCQTKEL
jgi:hypothetical protein